MQILGSHRYNYLDYTGYKYFQGSNDPWFCATCCSAIFPFASLSNNCFLSAISGDRFNKNDEKQVELKDTSLLLNPSPNLALLFNQFHTTRPEVNDDPDYLVNSKYYSINEIQSLTVANKKKSISIFHINTCSSNKNFDHLEYLLKCTNKKIDVVAVTELELLEIPPNYATLDSRITQLSPLKPNHQQKEHYFTLQITCLINLLMT